MVHVLRGSAEGLTVRDATSISGADVGIEDDFGAFLAADHFRRGPYADVVVYGNTRRGGRCDEGVLITLRGGPDGLDARHAVSMSRDPKFGCCGGLASGDVDGDGDADLIVPTAPYDGSMVAWLFLAGSDGQFGRGVLLTANALGLRPHWDTVETALLDTDGDGRRNLLVGAAYADETSRLAGADLSANGATGATDLTGTLKDLSGPGPGGEFIR
jgi:hypothetical protein